MKIQPISGSERHAPKLLDDMVPKTSYIFHFSGWARYQTFFAFLWAPIASYWIRFSRRDEMAPSAGPCSRMIAWFLITKFRWLAALSPLKLATPRTLPPGQDPNWHGSPALWHSQPSLILKLSIAHALVHSSVSYYLGFFCFICAVSSFIWTWWVCFCGSNSW